MLDRDAARLFHALTTGGGSSLLDAAAEAASVQLLLFSNNWKLGLYSRLSAPSPRPVCLGEDGCFYIQPDLLDRLGSIEQEPLHTAPLGAECFCTIMPLGPLKLPTGYLLVLNGADRLSPRQQEILTLCRQLFERYSAKLCESDMGLRPPAREQTLRALLDQAPTDPTALERMFHLPAEHRYFACVVSAGEKDAAGSFVRLLSGIRHEGALFQDGRLLLLLSLPCARACDFTSAQTALRAQLLRAGLTAGMSYPFDSILKFSTAAGQAVQSLKYGTSFRPETPLTTFWDIAWIELIMDCFQTGNFAQQALHSDVQRVIDYDNEKGTDYFRIMSLCTLLNGNINACAQVLGVSWSAADKKIRRIQELFGIDLKSTDKIAELQFSCALESVPRTDFCWTPLLSRLFSEDFSI